MNNKLETVLKDVLLGDVTEHTIKAAQEIREKTGNNSLWLQALTNRNQGAPLKEVGEVSKTLLQAELFEGRMEL